MFIFSAGVSIPLARRAAKLTSVVSPRCTKNLPFSSTVGCGKFLATLCQNGKNSFFFFFVFASLVFPRLPFGQILADGTSSALRAACWRQVSTTFEIAKHASSRILVVKTCTVRGAPSRFSGLSWFFFLLLLSANMSPPLLKKTCETVRDKASRLRVAIVLIESNRNGRV